MRAGPSTDYEIIGALGENAGTSVTGQNAEGDWWQIEVNGLTGWVFGPLVTAENVDDVPVVEVAPPAGVPATEPETDTEVPTESEETSTEDASTEDAPADPSLGAEQVVVAAPVASSGPITVTLTEAEDDPDALRTFLRTALVGVGPGNTSVAVSVGAVPVGLPISLTLPQTATVLGGVIRTGEFENSQIYLTSPNAADDLLAVVRQQLLADGFAPPTAEQMGGSGPVFLSTDGFAMPLLLCTPDDSATLALRTITVAGESEVVSLTINPTSGFGGPCGDGARAGGDIFAVLPQLLPPNQTQVRATGSGSGGGSGSFHVSASAEIESSLSVLELAATL